MSADLYTDLLWLPKAPADFPQQCRNLPEGDCGDALRFLATHALDENQLTRLAKAVDRITAAERSIKPLVPFKLGVVSNATSHLAVPALIASGLRHGLLIDVAEADYGQVMQEALDPRSLINQAKPDAVLLAIDHRGLPIGDGDTEACLSYLDTIRAGIRGSALCIVQTIPRPPESLFGNADLNIGQTLRHAIDAVNRGIADSLSGTPDVLFDVAGLAETVGLAEWHDPTLWNMAKVPFATRFLPLYAEHVCRIIAALRGKSRKCLVLDLDNTVWGGVIGDDGLEGIVIGQGDATGEAHLAVQRMALALRERGIVLAVSSKNDDAIARFPFRSHPEMLLKEEHIAVFQANWQDKATNIQAIARELSLGVDAMVLLDDNPVERALVRKLLPQVGVPELPPDPALYARTLLAAGYFEAIAFSAEDKKRADYYRDNAKRATLERSVGGVEAYLTSLAMVIGFRPFDETGRARITQLINKSNQFNLTTRRYSEADVLAAERDPDCFTLQVRLSDSFGDNGMISVIICRRAATTWKIDTWLMSCRVLGRKVERAVLQEILHHARNEGIDRLEGTYLPTERNRLVEDHYADLGFSLVSRADDGSTVWELAVADAAESDLPMRVEREGFARLAA
jgi:FkbH-like protein